MSEYTPCSNCSIMKEIYDSESIWFLDSQNACDGCFFYEYGCTEEEFYEYEEYNSPSECEGCKYHNCQWRSLVSGYKCAY